LDFLYTFPTAIEARADGTLALDWNGRDPFAPSHPLEVNGAIAYPQLLPGAFSAEECARINALGDSRILAAAAVDQRSDLASHDYRVSQIAWIEPAADAQWLYHRLGVLFAQANAAWKQSLRWKYRNTEAASSCGLCSKLEPRERRHLGDPFAPNATLARTW